MLDQHQLIADLEAEIDGLRDSAERCRKIDMAAKAAMGVGVALLLVSFFWFSASALVIGIAGVLGSVALVGSNRGTLGEIITGIYAAFDVAHRHPETPHGPTRPWHVDPILPERATAKWLSVSVSTLQRWRAKGEGPAWVRLSERGIGYRASVVEGWLAQAEVI